MRFTFSLLNAFSQRNQNTNSVPQDVYELTQDELEQVYGGHGKDCHQSCHHKDKNHHEDCHNYCDNEYNNYCDSSYYNCYTY